MYFTSYFAVADEDFLAVPISVELTFVANLKLHKVSPTAPSVTSPSPTPPSATGIVEILEEHGAATLTNINVLQLPPLEKKLFRLSLSLSLSPTYSEFIKRYVNFELR